MLDDPRGLLLAEQVQERCLLFGEAEDAEIRGRQIRTAGIGTMFELMLPTGEIPVSLSVPGCFMVSNALAAAEAAVEAIRKVPGVILPFPGGVVRSGSKVGSKYKGQFVSTNTAYCPTIRRQVQSALPEGVNAVMEIVIDGLEAHKTRRW